MAKGKCSGAEFEIEYKETATLDMHMHDVL
jgi:hypothetical protein